MNAITSTSSSSQSGSKPLMEQALLTRLTEDGPTSNEVATTLLREELKTLYPTLSIDLDKTVVGTPIWEFVDDELTCVDIQYTRLTYVLVQISRDNTKVNYLPGEHFLTQQPSVQDPIQLPVNIEQIAILLNDLASVFYVAFKEQQLAFWNATGTRLPRWQELADGLAAALNIQEVEGWNADQCNIARGVSSYPDKQERLTQRPDLADIQVCLLDIDTPNGANLNHLLLAGTAVVKGTFNKTDVLMMYTIEFGYETFPSLQDLAASVQTRLSASMSTLSLSVRLVEPEGNFFDHMAWALIASQLKAIEAEGINEPPTALPENAPSTSEETAETDPDEKHLIKLEGAIPDWLSGASPNDQHTYSQHVLKLSEVYSNLPTEQFQIPSIKTFAQEKMRNAIIADKKSMGADKLPLDDLQITITDPLSAGPFTLPNTVQSYVQTLGEYALSNTPPYLATLRFKGAEKVPDWLTDSYLTQISEQVDIGKVYPQLIKDKLIDDAAEAGRQKRFYTQQLRSSLPLLALECKLTHTGNVDEQGCHYINELVNPTPNAADPIVIRPLAIRPGLRIPQTFDDVLNIYIIAPRTQQNALCLLYRPLLQPPLMQFPSLQNLLYELHQEGDLRDSILAWLPNQTLSFNYAQYVFLAGLPSPWLFAELATAPLKLLQWSGGAVFSDTELTGDVFDALFDRNTKAMVELADRESLSNAERRWTLLKDSGWAIFNAASNFFNGTAATAVWVWQVFDQLQQVVDANKRGNSLIKWQSLGDVLMALAIVIAHQAGPRRRGIAKTSRAGRTRPRAPVPPQVHATASENGALHHSRFSTLAVEGAVPRRTPAQWDTYLDAYKVEAPDLSDKPAPQERPPLYDKAGKTYAQVDQRWFQVVGDDEANVHILDPNKPTRTGPCLAKTPEGTWRIRTDLRLLRNDQSVESQRKAQRKLSKKKLPPLEAKREALDQSEQVLKLEMDPILTKPMTLAKANRGLAKAQELITNRQAALELLKQWRADGGIKGYRDAQLKLYKSLNRYLIIWNSLKRANYEFALERIKQNRNSEDENAPQQLVTDINLANQMGREIETKLNDLVAVQHELSQLGAAGALTAREIKMTEKYHSRWALKSNEIANATELCVQEQAAKDMEEARDAVSAVVDNATTASREMTDLLKDYPQGAPLETLAALEEQFQSIRVRIDELPGTYSNRVNPDALNNLKRVVDEFLLLAQSNIGSQLQQEAEPGPSRRKPPKPHTPKPFIKPKVIKKRPRNQPKKTEDILEQKPVTLIEPRKKKTQQKELSYEEVIAQGEQLTYDLDALIQKEKKSAKVKGRIPTEMQEIFNQHALKMEQTLATFEPLHAEAKKAGTDKPVASLSTELRDGAARLRREGINTRREMLKLRKPRQSYFEWLLNNKQVRVTRNDRGRIPTAQPQDYFQEYFILDSTNNDQPLWLAHFHYAHETGPAHAFTAAHLKIDERYLNRLPTDLQQSLNNRSALDNHLRKLSDPELLAVFLQLEKRGN